MTMCLVSVPRDENKDSDSFYNQLCNIKKEFHRNCILLFYLLFKKKLCKNATFSLPLKNSQ